MELQKIMTTTEAFEMMFIVLKLSCTVSGIIKCKDSWEKDLQGPNLDICVKDWCLWANQWLFVHHIFGSIGYIVHC